MNAILDEFESAFKEIEKYLYYDFSSWDDLDKIEQQELLTKRKEANDLYAKIRTKLYALLHSSTSQEIIEAFQQGSSLLQAHLGGHMLAEFKDAYISTMTKAIEDDHEGSYLFLKKLETVLNEERLELLVGKVIVSSRNRSTLQNALQIIKDHKITTLNKELRQLADEKDEFENDIKIIFESFL